MKYNNREKQAIETLDRIVKVLKGEYILWILDISESDANSLCEVFGINLMRNCYSKKDVKKFVRGKDDMLIRISHDHGQGPYFNYCIFPFQVKEVK